MKTIKNFTRMALGIIFLVTFSAGKVSANCNLILSHGSYNGITFQKGAICGKTSVLIPYSHGNPDVTVSLYAGTSASGTLISTTVDPHGSDDLIITGLGTGTYYYTLRDNDYDPSTCPGITGTFTVGTGDLLTSTAAVTCPGNLTANTSSSTCNAAVSYSVTSVGTLSYTFTGATSGSGSGTGSGATFNKGVTTVTITATDICGHASCSFNITVSDNTAPIAVAQNVIIYLDGSGNATTTAAAVNNGSTDNCSIAGMSLEKTSFDWTNVGNNNVVLTVTDGSGNSSTANAVVTVIDNTNPVAIAKDITISLDGSGHATITAGDVDNGSSDNGHISGMTLDNYNFDCSNLGSDNTVILTVTDEANNVSTATATITVIDDTKPTIVTKDATIYLDGSGAATLNVSDIENGSHDNCSTDLNLTLSKTNYTCADLGTQSVTLSGTDGSSNTGTAMANVTVIDAINPVAVAQNVTIYLDAAGNASVTASQVDNNSSDNCGITTWALSQYDFVCSEVGAHTVTLTVTDASGNHNSADATVTVVDNIKPTVNVNHVTLHLDATGNASTSAADVNNASSDNCTIQDMSLSKTAFTCADKGDNTVTLTVNDVNGNSNSADATVTVVDDMAPNAIAQGIIINLDENGSATITAEDVNNGSNDNCGSVSLSINNGSFNCSNLGDNDVILTVTDGSNNTSTAHANVTVKDVTAPNAVAQNVTIYLDANGMASTSAAAVNNGSTDNCSIASMKLSQCKFDCSNLGDNNITLTVTDGSGNGSVASAVVTVKDGIAPVASAHNFTLDLVNGSGTIAASDIDNGSSDNCSFTLSLDKSSFTCADAGDNTVTLTVTDAAGNISTATAIVTVNAAASASTISADGPTTFCAGGSVVLTASANTSYCWTNENGPIFNGSGSSITVQSSGTYYVSARNSYGCSATSSPMVVTVNPLPTAVVSSNTPGVNIYYYPSATLHGASNLSGADYSWSLNSNGSSPFSTIQTTIVSPTSATTYYLVVSKNGCYAPNIPSITITVDKTNNISCGPKNSPNAKVTMCTCTGKSTATVCVDTAAIGAHLSKGDYFGSCFTKTCGAGNNFVAETGNKLNIYPNPFSSIANIDMTFGKNQQVTVEVIAIDGRTMKTLFNGNVEQDMPYHFQFDGTTVNPGMYFVRVITADHADFRKIELFR